MRVQRFAFLLLLYLGADFANPLMAGAVTFTDGSIAAVHADRPELAEVAPDALARGQRRPVEPQTWRRPRPPPGGCLAHCRMPVCRSSLARPDPPSYPTSEDH
jgi:hypothetical protein